ncbi:hypothetical protein ACFQ9X_45500 [Catenulispora yoronensis]
MTGSRSATAWWPASAAAAITAPRFSRSASYQAMASGAVAKNGGSGSPGRGSTVSSRRRVSTARERFSTVCRYQDSSRASASARSGPASSAPARSRA